MIESQQLTRRYGDFIAVERVSFQIGRGEIVGLLGHNGAGKSTIMKMLTGFLEPSSGVALVDGVAVEQDPMRAKALLGYLPENLPLYPEMQVTDYLAYVATIRGVDPRRAVPRALHATELNSKAFATISTLSRGLKQRVGVAQAILHEPDCLILDEPTNGLDPSQTQHMRALIKQLAERATVILSTHIMQEVDAICDRALILRGGGLVLDERLASLRTSHSLRLRIPAGLDPTPMLAALNGMSTPVAMDDGIWEVFVAGSPDKASLDSAAAAINQALVTAGISVYGLAPVQRDLESVFRSANEGEPVHAS